MSVSNGQLANQTTFNNAFVSRLVDTSTVGKLDLNNSVIADSGPTVTNVQRHINDFIQNAKLFVYTLNEGTMSWSGTALTFSEDIKIRFEDNGVINTILATNSPVTLADGESVYVTLTRDTTGNLTPVIASSLPTGKDIFRFVTRIGNDLFFYDGSVLLSGYTAIIGLVGSVNNGTAGRLAIYPSAGYVVDDVYTQNSQSIDVLIEAQATRSAGIEYTIPNPGDAVTAASFVLTEGAQTINGNKTFGNDVVISGDLTVAGTTTTVSTTNTLIKDKLITLNDGGAAASGGGSGIEIEENAIATGYFKTSSDRNSWELKAPNVAGVATLTPDATSRTYTLPAASGTLLTDIVQDTTPQLGGELDVNGNAIVSASNGNIIVAPNGTGRVLLSTQGSLTQYADEKYFHGKTISASTTAVLSDLTFDTTVYKSQLVEYQIREATTNGTRVGRLFISVDGASGVAATNVDVVNFSGETEDIGVSWSGAMSGNNAQISYTKDANAATIHMVVKRFLA